MNTFNAAQQEQLANLPSAAESLQAIKQIQQSGPHPVTAHPEQTPFMRRASILIERNIPVAPLPPRTKAAKTTSWQKLATTDPVKLQELNPDPDGNTAAVARAEIGGFCFFEVDAPNFHEVIEKQTGRKFPQTFMVSSSPGKGKGHFYFKQTPKSVALGNAQAKDENGKEAWSFRADRRYVVGPLSVKEDGTVYTVIRDVPIADCPDWLVEWIAANRAEVKKTDSELDESPINQGSRNNTLTSILGKAREVMKMDREQLEAYGLSVNSKRCVPPLPDDEVQKIAGSVSRYPLSKGLQLKMGGNPLTKSDGQGQQPQARPVHVDDRPMESESVNPSEISVNSSDSLPSATLASTRLQDIFWEYFIDNGWPLELALPALVTAASVVVPPRPREEGKLIVGDDMTNLYTALIAPVHAGKSKVIEWGCRAIGIHDDPIGSHYYEGKWGSAEQMLRSLHRKQSVFTSKAVLITPDEWAHLFAKAAIPDASFPTILNTAFYRRNHIITLGGANGGKEYSLNLAMSFIGGIVEDEFDTVFGASSLGGLYDRFLFGRAPDKLMWSYRPCPIPMGPHFTTWNLKPTWVNPEVYEVTRSWGKEMPDLGRIAEICTRVATIYACLDGRPEVKAKDIEALKGLALYQIGLRQIFRPNPGQSPDAVFANTALAWINKHASEWTSISKLKQHTWRVESKLGPAVAVRSLIGLARSGRIDLWLPESGRPLPADYHGPKPRIGLVRRVK